MHSIFHEILDMSITASLVILIVLVLRFFLQHVLRKTPKVFSYALWAVVLFRLLCPISIESSLSVIPSQIQEIPQTIALEESDHVSVGQSALAAYHAIGDALNGGLDTIYIELDSEDLGYHGTTWAYHDQVWLLFLGTLWPMGMAAMLIYSTVSFLRLRKRLVGSIHLRDNIYLSDHIDSPFVMGLWHPRIYLPSDLSSQEESYILLHEQHHIRRLDHITKLLSYLALCLHWFNPLAWAAFILSGKDMEMSCDEAVVRQLGENIRADYSASLLSLSMGHRIIAGVPLAFGEGDPRGRIRNLAHWKKPTLRICIVAGILCVAAFIFCAVNPKLTSDAAKVVGEYDISTLGGEFLHSGDPAYQVGANRYGMPVFYDTDAAFAAMQQDYDDALDYLARTYDLRPITKRHYDSYKKLGAQVTTEDERLRAGCMAVSQFLDLYENSFSNHSSSGAPATSGNAVYTTTGLYTGGDLLAQSAGLSFQPENGSYYKQIHLSNGSLTVISSENVTLYDGNDMMQSSCSREDLIDRLESSSLYAPTSDTFPGGLLKGDLLDAFVPKYEGFRVDICHYFKRAQYDATALSDFNGNNSNQANTSNDTYVTDEIAYTIYWFDGVPTWFVEGKSGRFYEMILCVDDYQVNEFYYMDLVFQGNNLCFMLPTAFFDEIDNEGA